MRRIREVFAILMLIIIIISSLSACSEEVKPISIESKVGEIVYYGNYEQDNKLKNGKEKIAWKVLAVESGKALLISEKILDFKRYNDFDKDVSWETCTLRQWLNNEFMNSAFTAEEQQAIEVSNVVNEVNPKHGTDGGNNTQDKIFLLSYDEAAKYIKGNDYRKTRGTNFAKSSGHFIWLITSSLKNTIWWLRSPGSKHNYAGIVDFYGIIYRSKNKVDNVYGVRPAIWIKLQ